MLREIIDGVLADPGFHAFLGIMLAAIAISIPHWLLLRGHKRYSAAELPDDPPGLQMAARAYRVAQVVLSLSIAGILLYGRYQTLSVDTAILIMGGIAFVYLLLSLGVYLRYGLVSSARRYRYMLPEFTGWKRGLLVAIQFAGFLFTVAVAEWTFKYLIRCMR